MTRSEKAERIHAILAELYPEPPVPLDHRDPFTLLVAVLLSAQTTDARVNMVTPSLFGAAATPHAMAALGQDAILEHIKTCGLAPGKSRAIASLSTTLVEDYGGEVPADFEALEALPGVGHKTASVVMAQAFGVPAFPVDTHIHRLAARWGLSKARNVTETERDLKQLFPRESWNDLHLQIIYFGREHCPARRHDLSACPICSWAASKKRIAEEARSNMTGAGKKPTKTKKESTKKESTKKESTKKATKKKTTTKKPQPGKAAPEAKKPKKAANGTARTPTKKATRRA